MANIDKRRRDIDWAAMRQDYRAGVLSLRKMALKHGCSHSAIANFASRNGWSRDVATHDPAASLQPSCRQTSPVNVPAARCEIPRPSRGDGQFPQEALLHYPAEPFGFTA